MHIHLAYGKDGLSLDLPDALNVTVIEPRFVEGLADEAQALRSALRTPFGGQPLRARVGPGDRVGIVFSDITRATPNGLILPAVLDELRHIPPPQVILCCALGTHRANTPDELRTLFAMRGSPQVAEELLATYRVVQNDAFDVATQVQVGDTTRGHALWINREIAQCDVKVLTGFIEPHFFAGFSGGGKALMPGMAGLRTVLGNHDAANIGSPNATWGVTHGNHIWEEVTEAAEMIGGAFLVNVALNKHKQITGVFTGALREAHAAGCAFVRETAMAPVSAPFDIVVTTNSGYPLDLNLYQAVKGMSAAAKVVKQGGLILCAAECWDGIPDHGLYGQLLRAAAGPQALLDRILTPGFLMQDQWQAQIQAQIQLKAEVHLYADGLSDAQIRQSLLTPCRDIAATVCARAAAVGPGCTICILPEGPQTIPYVV